ncbi:MAG: PAS domain S-box protein [Proteobacteria bacterium]|nr:PAS domain S-box protein [Pseudomonadota bacterium]HQR05035.1 PAS domain S-box protein [Rhodocyclaceae bacterium]
MSQSQRRKLILAGIVAILLIAIAAWGVFDHFARQIDESDRGALETLALGQKSQLENYLQERAVDALLLAQRHNIIERFSGIPSHDGESLAETLNQTARASGYRDIYLLAPDLTRLASLHDTPLARETLLKLEAVRGIHKTTLIDLHQPAADTWVFGIVQPVFPRSGGAPIGLVYLELDADAHLFPRVALQSLPFDSAEAVLTEIRNGEITYLSPLRFTPDARPRTTHRELANLALRDTMGLPSGATFLLRNDYRGETVEAISVPVEDTPWEIVVKADRRELARPLHVLRGLVLAASGVLALLIAMIGRTLWQYENQRLIAARDTLAAHYDAARHTSIDAYVVLDALAIVTDCNDAMLAMTGWTRHELIGMPLATLDDALTPEELDAEMEKIRMAGSDRFRTCWRDKAGGRVDVDISATWISHDHGGSYHAFARDIGPELAARRQIEHQHALNVFLKNANAAIFNAGSEDQVLTQICRAAILDGRLLLAWAGLLDATASHIVPSAAEGVAAGYVRNIVVTTDPELATSQGPVGRCMATQRIVCIADFQQAAETRPWHDLARQHGFGAVAAVPIVLNRESIGALAFYAAETDFFSAETADLLEEAARNVSLALQTLRTRQEREKIEAARHESEERFVQVADASPLPMQIFSLSQRTLRFVNRAYRSSFGYTLEDLPDDTVWLERMIPDPGQRDEITRNWRDTLLPALRQASLRGEPIDFRDIPLCRKDGSSGIYRGFMNLFGDDLITQWLDITSIRAAEKALKDNERRFRGLIEQSLTGIYVSQDNRIVYANPRMTEISGWTLEELLGQDPVELLGHDPDTQDMVQSVRSRLEAGETSVALNLHFLRKDGRGIELGIHAATGIWDGAPAAIVLAQDITERRSAEEKIAAQVKELEATLETTLEAVATMVDMRDPYTAGHERRVGQLAADLAREMGWDEKQCHNLQLAGLVHDIGKIAIPAEILAKPSRLTDMEYALIKTHAEKSYEILKDVKSPYPVADIIRQHHERLDGSGYPRGLKGEEIFPEARVLAVADVVESMASHRPYRAALGMEAALTEIERNSGKWFDPDVVATMVRMVREEGYQLPT